jgi:hypothetical protein
MSISSLQNIPFDTWIVIFTFIEPLWRQETLLALLFLCSSFRADFSAFLSSINSIALFESIVFKL